MFGERTLTHPGDIVINGVPYTLDVNPKSNPPNQFAWEEEPVLNGTEPQPGPGLKHTRIPGAAYAWLSEQTLETFHMGMGDALDYEENTYHYAQNVDAGEPNAVVLGPLAATTTIGVAAAGDPVGYFELGGRLYAIWSRYIRELGTLNDTVTDTADKDFGSGVHVSDVKLFRNAAMIALGNATPMQSRATGAAAGTYTAADSTVTADYFAVSEEFLYRADSDGSNTRVMSVPTASSPLTAGNWSSEIDIGGDPGIAFTDLTTYGYQVLVGKRDGVYRTNRLGFAPNILDEFKSRPDASNARNIIKSFGNTYIPHMRGMFRYDGRGIQAVGLEKLSGHHHTNLSPVAGEYTATAEDGQWLYVALWNGTNTYILKYKELVIGDSIRGVWHPFIYWAANKVTGMHVSGITTSPSIWASSTTNELISRWFTAADARTPLTDSTYTFAATGSLWLPRLYMGSEENNKYFTEIVLEGDNLSSTETLRFYYRVTVNFPWSATSPSYTALAAVTSSPTTQTVGASGRFIEPRIDFARGTTTTETPVLRRVKIRAVQVLDYIRHVTCRVLLPAENQYLEGGELLGAIDDNTTETSYAVLRALENSASTLSVIDPFGTTRTMLLVDHIKAVAIRPATEHAEAFIVAELHLVEP